MGSYGNKGPRLSTQSSRTEFIVRTRNPLFPALSLLVSMRRTTRDRRRHLPIELCGFDSLNFAYTAVDEKPDVLLNC